MAWHTPGCPVWPHCECVCVCEWVVVVCLSDSLCLCWNICILHHLMSWKGWRWFGEVSERALKWHYRSNRCECACWCVWDVRVVRCCYTEIQPMVKHATTYGNMSWRCARSLTWICQRTFNVAHKVHEKHGPDSIQFLYLKPLISKNVSKKTPFPSTLISHRLSLSLTITWL